MTAKKQNPFKLRAFRGVSLEYIEKLEARGIRTAEQLLRHGRTREQRAALATAAGIPERCVLELVQMSDLSRLPGVKGIRARLYFEAGLDSVQKIADSEPEALRQHVAAYVERTGFDGIPPLPKEVSSTVANARQLPPAVVL